MYPKPIQTLVDLFMKFPGIGPRQAARFTFAIIKNNGFARELSSALLALDEKIGFCAECFRTAEFESAGQKLCGFCRDPKRSRTEIAVVEKESDLESMEKTGEYRGRYHVLGGTLSPFDSESPKRLRLQALYDRVKVLLEKGDVCEVILATNPTTEGDLTALYIQRVLEPLAQQSKNLKISRLGRGLSLGSELEYVDEVTLKNALTNRK